MKKIRTINTSNWSTGSHDDEMEMGSQTNLIVRKKKKKKQRDNKRIELLDNDVQETVLRSDLIDEIQSPSKLTSQNISPPKSIDVVVDIHEYKSGKTHRHSSSNQFDGGKSISRKTALHEKTNEGLKSSGNTRLQNIHDARNVIKSLDSIEDYKESSPNSESGEQLFEIVSGNKFQGEDIVQSNVEQKPRNRRQWDVPKDASNKTQNPPKPPRKRWSKDTSVIRLPETKSISPTVSSLENISPLSEDGQRPVPLPRASVQSDTFYGFDNTAFVSEPEEVLRIETDHRRESTKIEIRKVSSGTVDTEPSSTSNPENKNSSSQNRVKKDTVIAIDDESEDEPSFQDTSKKNNNRVLSIENIEGSDIGNSSSKTNRLLQRSKKKKKKTKSDSKSIHDTEESTGSQTLEEVMKDSNYASSEELIKSTSSWTKKTKKFRKESALKDRLFVSQDTSSTIGDDDESDEKPSGKSYGNALQGRRSRSRSEDDWSRRQSRVKKMKERKSEAASSPEVNVSSVIEDTQKKKKRKKRKQSDQESKKLKYICITVHRADMLEIDFITKHPMVKVHIVEAETGNYLRSVEEDSSNTYLQPVITGKFDFKENRSMIPIWEEDLIFEHDFDSLLATDDKQVVILFEIIDLSTFSEASINYDKFGNEGCWYKVAWAFLKPVGRNNTLHIDKKVRLQLYKPRRNLKIIERHKSDVYSWWKSNDRKKYPSSLFVTVTSIDPPKSEPVFYKQLTLHNSSDLHTEQQEATACTSESITVPKWSRLTAQSCKIPNDTFFETEASENGCFFLAFSNNGKYLACVLSEEYDYPIIVYEVEVKKIHVCFMGHKTFVYHLNWSNDDNQILSVSSDQTARVWDVQHQIAQHIEMIPHPSYVYCGKFEPTDPSIIVTGCYDKIARIWMKDKKSKNRELSQELEGHEGFVNSMCFQKNGTLLTADSVGAIILWTVKKNRKMPLRREWHVWKKIKVREIEGVTINTIVLHPLESRLLVHSRNNGLRILDLGTGVVLQKYNELKNQRIQSTACISPCGGLIFCGGEDSTLNVWNLETGKYLAKYTLDRNLRAVTCVDYHPYDQILAFSTFGSPASVKILQFNINVTGESVGLRIIEESSNRTHRDDIRTSVLNTSTSRSRLWSSGRKTTEDESSKETTVQLERNPKSASHESTKHNVSQNERRRNTESKLQNINQTAKVYKSQSASRLYKIIEKIDRILSNTSKSSDDIETGRNTLFTSERDVSTVFMSQNEKSSERGSKNSRSSISNIEDHSNSYFESSTASSSGNNIIELKTLQSAKNIDPHGRIRSKSAKEHRTKDKFDDDLSKTFSDSAANLRKQQADLVPGLKRGDFSSSNFMIFEKRKHFVTQASSSSESVGTYVVEKADVERNNDGKCSKTPESTISTPQSKTGSSITKIQVSENEHSIDSDATFAVHRKTPVPQPRRKKIT